MNLFFTSRRLKYFLLARHRKGHGIHSPFVFNLFSEIFLNKPDPAVVKTVVDLKRRMLHIRQVQGANLLRDGSLKIDNIPEKGRGWVERIYGCDKYCRLLALLARKVTGLPVLQIGGVLSMATLAMAAEAPDSKVIIVNRRTESEEGISSEGTPGEVFAGKETPEEETSGVISSGEETLGEGTAAEGISEEEPERAGSADALTSYQANAVVTGNIEMRLIDKEWCPGNICSEAGKAGLILVVANSCRNKLFYCFDMLAGVLSDETIVIIENIHLSPDLEDEWNRLISDRRVSVSIDLLRYGILFFRKGIPKQNFLIRY
ncbi:MAG: hypothetical protein ABR519_10170 [Bacteroidales bacterium]